MYCDIHHTNNCLVCALERQTKQIVAAISGARSEALPVVGQPQPIRSGRLWSCWLGGHDWRIAAIAVTLDADTPIEQRCNILRCRLCPKTKVSYGNYPPRRMPSHPPMKE